MIASLFGLALAGMQTAEPARIMLGWDGKACATLAKGTPLPTESLERAVKDWARRGRPVSIAFAADVPYRCVGGVIFMLQVAGYSTPAQIEPPDYAMILEASVQFGVTPGKCGYVVNDAPVTAEEARALAADWAHYEVQVHFTPDPEAESGCVEAALAILKQANVSKLGLVGNEAVPEAQQ